jgi:hypothetical protein
MESISKRILIKNNNGWSCPYCNLKIPLTWRHYFSNPGYKHKCPHCYDISIISGKISLPLWVVRVLGVLIGGGFFGLLGLITSPIVGFFSFAFGCMTVSLPIDKYMDENYRFLTKIKSQKANQ